VGRVRRHGGVGGSGIYWYLGGATMVIGVLVVYRFWLAEIGYSTWVSPLYVAQVYSELRFDRAVGMSFGSGTHVLPPELYVATPWFLRVPLQAAGMLVVPMPWLLTSASRLLAFADSVLLIACIGTVLGAMRRREFDERFRQLAWWMLAVFFLTVAALGVVISNGGNAFRMRIGLFPYVFIPLAVYLGTRRRGPRPAAVEA